VTIPVWVKGAALLVVIFAAGVATGIGYERRQGRSHQVMSSGAHDMIHHLASELDLDSTQQQAIKEILARHQSEVNSTWHTMRPHVRATMDSAYREIVAVLKPEQAEKFRRLMDGSHSMTHH
jgi:hypothetical protein